MKNHRKIRLGLTLGMVMVFSAAHAAPQSGWYMGLSGGKAMVDVHQGELDVLTQEVFERSNSVMVQDESSLEDSDAKWSLFGGYRFNQFLAIEAGYTSLGTTQYLTEGTVFVYGSGVPGVVFRNDDVTFDIDSETKGFNTGLVANLPLGASFDLHANLGLLFSDTEITMNSSSGSFGFGGNRVSDSLSGSDQDVFYGAGLGWHLSEKWSLSLDYQLYKDVGSEDTGETDIDAVTLAAVFHF